jgi:hypothetical protein
MCGDVGKDWQHLLYGAKRTVFITFNVTRYKLLAAGFNRYRVLT